MEFVDGPVQLGEWLPDLYDLKFPNLVRAEQVEPVGRVYKSFEPLSGSGQATGGATFPKGLHVAVDGAEAHYYVAQERIYRAIGGSAFTAMSSTHLSTMVDFLQYDDLEIAALSSQNYCLFHTIGSQTTFATLGSSVGNAPGASRIGKINQFVFLGALGSTTAGNVVRWSGIDDPLSWPTPGSATAIAQQSGEQVLGREFGPVSGFANGDQFGLIFQTAAITRVTYVGPPVVFQFDKVSDKIGCAYPRSIVQVGGWTYFIANSGIHRTNGVAVEDIGLNKVNRYFLSEHESQARERVYGAVDHYKGLIYWTFCETSDTDSTPSTLLIYNYLEGRFTEASQVCQGLFSTYGGEGFFASRAKGLGVNYTLMSFSGTPSSLARFETGDIEFNPGGFSRLSGAKLLVDATANAVIGYAKTRNLLVGLTTSAASTTNSATGFCDFNLEARYHRLSFELSGEFDQAQAMEFKVKKSGSR